MKKQDIKELMKYFSGMENISKMKLKHEDVEIELEKEAVQVVTAPAPVAQTIASPVAAPAAQTASTPAPVVADDRLCITSPMVGTFYQAPAPGAKVFAAVGDSISKGQTVAIIEAMKIMNEIEAEYDCKIVKILVEDGQPVEYDMPLFEVEKI